MPPLVFRACPMRGGAEANPGHAGEVIPLRRRWPGRGRPGPLRSGCSPCYLNMGKQKFSLSVARFSLQCRCLFQVEWLPKKATSIFLKALNLLCSFFFSFN